MTQIFHIFRKDIRHLTPFILAMVALELFSTICTILENQTGKDYLPGVVPLFLPFVWIFLLSTVVLQERLPGSSQYWLTRPIGWKKLFAAKLLFVLVFGNVLLFLVDCPILLALRLPVRPSLFLSQVQITVLLFIPAFCLGSLAKNFAQIVFALIAATFILILENVAIDGPGFEKWLNGLSGASLCLVVLLALALTLAVAVFQFARRATIWSRLLALLPLLLVPAVAQHEFVQRAFLEEIPDPDLSRTVQVSFDLDSGRYPLKQAGDDFSGLQLPLSIHDLPPGATSILGVARVEVQSSFNHGTLYRDRGGDWLRVWLFQGEFGRLPSRANMRASFFLTVVKAETAQVTRINESKLFSLEPGVNCRSGFFSSPGIFVCWSGMERRLPRRYQFVMAPNPTPLERESSILRFGNTDGNPNLDVYARDLRHSPVQTWVVSSRDIPGAPVTRLRFEADIAARVVALASLGRVERSATAQQVELKQYLIQP